MILFGRDLSPFARRLTIFCALQGHEIERRALLVVGEDFETLKSMNPVGRIPVLELDDGTQLSDTYAIGDWLDETSPNGRRMLPASGVERRAAFQRLALANGTAEKTVALVYERNRRPEEYHYMEWQQRLVSQIQGGLAALDAAVPASGWSGPDGADAGDVAAAIAYQMVEITNPWVLEPGYPQLAAFAERVSAEIPAFAETKPSL
ncbi:MAG: glutathione S-transferase family protein [Pseudomonadota bacterium]